MAKRLLNFDAVNITDPEHNKAAKLEDTLSRDIAIIGMAVYLPMADNVDEFWHNIYMGTNCICDLSEPRKTDIIRYMQYFYNSSDNIEYLKAGFLREIDKFDYKFFSITKKEAGLMDPNQRIFLETAWKAIEDAGYGGGKLKGSRTGVFLGFGGSTDYMKTIGILDAASVSVAIPGNLPPITASRISFLLDLRGPSFIIDTACSSSLVAVHYACQSIRNNECGMAIAGGIKIMLSPINNRAKMGIESESGCVRTFDDKADGTLWGEGSLAILLKPLNKALDDKDNIHAVIKGSTVNQDGNSIGITAPNPAAQEDLIIRALQNAGIDPETISYIEAHGTATKLGDPIEVEGISKAFKKYTDKKQFCAIGSVKTNIGHLDYAAGIAGLVKAVLSLKHKQIPPTLFFDIPNKKIPFENSPVYIADRIEKWESDIPKRCSVSSFGLSGTNCHLILEEAPERRRLKSAIGLWQILTISAKSIESLKRLIEEYSIFIEKNTDIGIADICYTANTGRGHYNYRAAVLFDGSRDDLMNKIRKLSRSISNNSEKYLYYGVHKLKYGTGNTDGAEEITDDEVRSLSALSETSLKQYIKGGKKDNNILEDICELYIKGTVIRWELLYHREDVMKVSIPTYSFEKSRCWLDIPEIKYTNGISTEPNSLYMISWKENYPVNRKIAVRTGNILVLKDNTGRGEKVICELIEKGYHVIEVSLGYEFEKLTNSKYTVRGIQEDFDKLVTIVFSDEICQIIYMFGLETDANYISGFEQSLGVKYYTFFRFLKSLINRDIKSNVDLLTISEYAEEITGKENRIIPASSAMSALGKVLNMEYRYLQCRNIDIDDHTDIASIIKEIEGEYSEYKVAYRADKRYSEVMEILESSPNKTEETCIKDGGVYLITGGTGNIGLKMGRYFASKAKVKIILVSRTEMPLREEWDDVLLNNSDKKLCNVMNNVREMEKEGSTVSLYKADVSEESEIRQVIENVKQKYVRIDGIIHAAGIGVGIKGSLLRNEDEDHMRSVIAPKLSGTFNIYNLMSSDELDFFIAFSSMITLTGAVGASSYTVANTYLDVFASNHTKNGNNVIVINWPLWEDTPSDELEKKHLFRRITANQAFSVFEKAVKLNCGRVLVGEFNYDNDLPGLFDYLPFKISDAIKNSIAANYKQRISSYIQEPSVNSTVQLKGRDTNEYTETEQWLAGIWNNILGVNEININDDFFEIGGNSISSIKLETDIEEKGFIINPDDISKYRTIKEMSEYLIRNNNYTDNSKLLDNIEPFNDIYYRSCFFNSLFPVVRHFSKDILCFLSNDIPCFKYDEKSSMGFTGLIVEYLQEKDYTQILNEMGIIIQARSVKADLIKEIKSCINRSEPVIIWVDCFYEPLVKDMYQKVHSPHTVLIYGYNDMNKVCNVIEHANNENLYYSKYDMSYNDIRLSYNGYLENFCNDSYEIAFFCFSESVGIIDNISSSIDIKRDYSKVINKNISLINNSLDGLALFLARLKSAISDELILGANASNLVDCLNNIINSKYIEQYRMQYFSRYINNMGSLISIIDKNIVLWKLIRAFIVKYLYSSIYNKISSETIIQKVEEVFSLEVIYKEEIIKCFEVN